MIEEIIKECEFYLPLSENCNEILDGNGNEIYKCPKRQDCYYKQLKRLEQVNKELKSQRDEARIAYNDLILDIVSDIPFEGEIGGERFISIKDRLYQMQKALASLEEIRTYLYTLSSVDSDFTNTETYLRIQDKINEVLGDEV